MLKLLIADTSDSFTDALCEQLNGIFEISVCNDGHKVLSLLRNTSPDLLLLDMMLPGCDGLTILESVCTLAQRPVILVVSRIFSFYVQDSMERLGVSYAMQKPCDVPSVCNRLRELARYPKAQLLPAVAEEERISGILHALGFNGKHIGYRCLAEAIRLIACNPNQQYTKELYPTVGEMVGCTWRQVERDIRTAIALAWENRNPALWQEFFPNQPIQNKKPTNSTFIAALGQLVQKSLTSGQKQENDSVLGKKTRKKH